MKNYSYILVVALMAVMSYNAQAQNWVNYTPDPCQATLNSIVWEGPKVYTFCGSDVSSGPLSNCDNCCYKVIYYDNYNAIMASSEINQDYQISAVGIFFEGEGCENCLEAIFGSDYKQEAKETILRKFYELHFSALETNAGFRRRIGTNDTEVLAVPGECKRNGEKCSSTCCYKKIYILRNLQTGLPISYNWETMPPEVYPDCTSPCAVNCNNTAIPFRSVPVNCNDFGCDYGDWETNNATIEISESGCEGCQITVTYESRYANGPGCEYPIYDYSILSFQKGSGCENCNLGGVQILGLIEEWLILNGGHPIPKTGCSDYIRISKYSCMYWDSYTGEFVQCPAEPGCCWGIYQVCQPGNVITPVNVPVLLGACNFQTYSCTWTCNNQLESIIQKRADEVQKMKSNTTNQELNNKLEMTPNPPKDEIKIQFNDDNTGPVIIEIIDIYGAVIEKLTYNKSINNFEALINTKNYRSGTYFVNVRINNTLVYKSKVSITK